MHCGLELRTHPPAPSLTREGELSDLNVGVGEQEVVFLGSVPRRFSPPFNGYAKAKRSRLSLRFFGRALDDQGVYSKENWLCQGLMAKQGGEAGLPSLRLRQAKPAFAEATARQVCAPRRTRQGVLNPMFGMSAPVCRGPIAPAVPDNCRDGEGGPSLDASFYSNQSVIRLQKCSRSPIAPAEALAKAGLHWMRAPTPISQQSGSKNVVAVLLHPLKL